MFENTKNLTMGLCASSEAVDKKTKVFKTIATSNRRNGGKLTAREAFNKYDTNKNGFIEKQEFWEATILVGLKLAKEDLDQAFADADTDNDGKISYEEFEAAVVSEDSAAAAPPDSQELEASMQEVFGTLDTDNSGTIEVSEFKEALAKLNIDVPEENFLSFDENNDGNISYNEFIQMFVSDVRVAEVKATFESYDLDGSGTISAEEFRQALQKRGVAVDDDSVKRFMSADMDGDGQVSYSEFLTKEVMNQLKFSGQA